MKQLIKKIEKVTSKIGGLLTLVLVIMFSSCEFDLPEEGMITDLTPPSAVFSFQQNDGDFLQLDFTNLSVSATDYNWDFGDGNSSTELHPSNTYNSIGTYSITLTASDKLGVINTITQVIEITEPLIVFEPEILNPGFDLDEDGYRVNWRNSDLGSVMQITSTKHEGVKAAKFPSDGSRIAYQLITVQKNKSYTISFYHRLKKSPVGSMTVAILAGHITDSANLEDATIGVVTITEQTDSYAKGSITFNSADNTEIAIYVTNIGVESKIDTFNIIENE